MTPLLITSLIIFALSYVLMFIFQKIRPYVALSAALIFVVLGSVGVFEEFSFTPLDALKSVDWNVLMMIAGTMGTVWLFIESKMPSRMADFLVSKTKNICWTIVVLSLFSGIISAFVDNVATVLMVAPVAVAICKKQNVSPVAAIICIAVSSNLQGAATLVGDTTSLLLAKQAGLDFVSFFVDNGKPGMFWVVEGGALVSAVLLYLMLRKEKSPVSVTERTKVDDYFPTYLLLGTIIALIAVSFIPYKDNATGSFYKPEITNGLICVGFFVVGLIREIIRKKSFRVICNAVKQMDYYTLLLLAGLFIVIGGIDKAGVIDKCGELLSEIGNSGSKFLIYTIIVWASVGLSAFIDNIPYTATMLPIIASLCANMGGIEPKLLYYGLLCGATLGGNLTPIGASANITGIGILRKEGYDVKSKTFMKYSVPFTLAAVTTGYLLIWFIWC